MKNSVLLMIVIMLVHQGSAQSLVGLEQYVYFGKSETISLVSVGYYQNALDWYTEVRYNYEERRTMSIYGGKTFYGEGRLSSTATPMLGILIGQFRGFSLGANLDAAYKKIELSSQIQYILAANDRTKSFLLNWSEISYEISPFMKSGLALQQSSVYRSSLELEAGAFIAFSYKNWGMPIYVFSPASEERNYVIGISWEWQHLTRASNNHGPTPSFKGRKKSTLE